MLSFVTRHASHVKGVLSGFDRVRFLGTLRWLAHVKGLLGYLSYQSVLLKEFREYAMSLTASIKQATQQIASEPIAYLPSSAASKDEVAREIAEREGITEGLVCVLSCVEPCFTFEVGPNKQKKELELRKFFGKCLHYYPMFGVALREGLVFKHPKGRLVTTTPFLGLRERAVGCGR
jgi:hypothetical protein